MRSRLKIIEETITKIFKALIPEGEEEQEEMFNKHKSFFMYNWFLLKDKNFLPPNFFFPIEITRLDFTIYYSLKKMNEKKYAMLMYTMLIIRILVYKVLLEPWKYNKKIPKKQKDKE